MNTYAKEIGDKLFRETSDFQSIIDDAEMQIALNNEEDKERFWDFLIAEINSWPSSGLENFGVSSFNKEVKESREKIKKAIELKMKQKGKDKK
ncbi:hypothetical protein F3J28_20935 [Enterobacter sp. Ap-1006]|uniref:hypothetical protein n=1 Tax=Enterobacter sp. Ap-1006 TaxID=2608345 RepID=UPI0014242EAA|nr:hypothetical protein [Enterobacter sp. Ap-1006]NIF50229.1 hypothetical protein [Enterobacter sp. Ap-1006]